ncbi:MAG TPA: FtsQ-type POTRA domain-containing protein [Candidatus Agathobaculum merdipullorum]|nr:FtsQ-type POTRA domain-containing protein [Candidatus Agathobaculum merdipullorum]
MRRRRRRQKTPEQVRRRVSRRQRFFHTIGRILFLGILLAAATLALTVFFKVDTITVEGAQKYRAEEIVAGMDVKQGDNLYLWNKVKVCDAMLEKFPYLQSVQIRRHLPNALVVTVTECSASVAIASNGGYLLLSKEGKALEQSANSNGLPVVTGMTLTDVPLGKILSSDSSEAADDLLTILQTLDAADMLKDLAFINLSDLHDIHIGYLKRFDIRVDSVDNLAYYLRFAQTVIEDRLSPSDIGQLYWDSQNRLHYVPDTAENIEKAGLGLASSPVVTDTTTKDSAEQTDAVDPSSSDSSGESVEETQDADDLSGEDASTADEENADEDA